MSRENIEKFPSPETTKAKEQEKKEKEQAWKQTLEKVQRRNIAFKAKRQGSIQRLSNRRGGQR